MRASRCPTSCLTVWRSPPANLAADRDGSLAHDIRNERVGRDRGEPPVRRHLMAVDPDEFVSLLESAFAAKAPPERRQWRRTTPAP